MDKYLLEYKIKSNGYTIKEYCEKIGLSTSAYYKRMRGEAEFTQGEIQRTMELLHIDDPTPIFFAETVS